MKKLLGLASIIALLSATSIASADEPAAFKVGGAIDFSVPSGAAVGLDATSPKYVPWFKLGASATYLLAPGYRLNLLADPINFPVAPVVNFDVGHQTSFTIPHVDNSPTVNFTYEEVQGGFRFGSREGFGFLLMGGMMHLDGNVYNLSRSISVGDGVSLGNPHLSLWAPDAKIAFNWLF
jgi:hypothetical protein